MRADSVLSHTFFGGLRKWLPKVFTSSAKDYNQPLLSIEEINDLQFRMLSHHAQPKNQHDTAHQHMGDTRSIHRGYGLDYEESRHYQPGDEPRYMNWQLTARTGELFMKVFREERRPGVFIMVDRRETMLFGTRTRLKVTQATRAATCLSFSAQNNHASISGLILNATPQSPHWINESCDKEAAANLIHAACMPCSPVTQTNSYQPASHQPQKNKLDFSYVLKMLQARLVPGTTVYLISDFIDLKEQHRSALMQLAAKNQIHAIHIFDPAEQRLPHVGNVDFQTSQDDQHVTIDTNSENINNAYENAALKHFTNRKQLFHALNISYTQISTLSDAIELELSAL